MSDPEYDSEEGMEADEAGEEASDNEELDEEEAQEEGEEEEAKAEEEEEEFEPNPLTEEMIRDTHCLTRLQCIGPGLVHAYTSFNASERELTDISMLSSFIHLRYVTLTGNHIKDISALNSMTNLLTLQAENNALKSAVLDELPHLQAADLSTNKIKSLEGIGHPMLRKLNISNNEISNISGWVVDKLAELTVLEFRGNKLTTTLGDYPKNITELYLGANLITKIEGLEVLENLVTLHLRENQLKKLDGFTPALKSIQYINLRGNAVEEMKEVEKLIHLPSLRALLLQENPIFDDDNYRIEVLSYFVTKKTQSLERLDKDEILEEEWEEAQERLDQRTQEQMEEKLRLAAETEEEGMEGNPAVEAEA